MTDDPSIGNAPETGRDGERKVSGACAGERDAKAGVRTESVHADSDVGSASVVRVSYAIEKRSVTSV